MLLETLDVRKNDVLIFSQNKFDFEDNFKIVFKRESNKRPRNITYFEVCEFVKEATPKNIILYRLLTNVESLDAYSTKYGYFINIQGKMELIYFDPIYAIKDLRHLRFNIEPEKFRFKIQQLGISYDTVRDSEPIYKEVFHFDLTASESQHQNDKIFADAIFIFDDSYHKEKPAQKEEVDFESGTAAMEEPRKFTMEINEGDVVEDEATVEKNLSKVNFSARKDSNSERDMKIEMLKVALGIKAKTENLENFRKSRTEPEEGIKDYGETSLLDLFKSTSKTNLLSNREKDNIILKLKDSSEE
jgi:hypothetical protein